MEEFDYKAFQTKALEQLKSGKPLLSRGGAFSPLLENLLHAALEGEMDAYMSEEERINGNRRNGYTSRIRLYMVVFHVVIILFTAVTRISANFFG
jgi:hypothetical protein